MKTFLFMMTLFLSFSTVAQDRVGNGANVLNEYAACDGDGLTFRIRGESAEYFLLGELRGSMSAKFRCQKLGDLSGNVDWENIASFYCSEKSKLIERLVVRVEIDKRDHRVKAKLKRIQSGGKRALELGTMNCLSYK